MKHKEHHMSADSVTHTPELIFINVVQGQHMTSALIMRLSGAEILCCFCGKECIPTGISICTCLEGLVNQAAAVQTYGSKRQSTCTNKQSLH